MSQELLNMLTIAYFVITVIVVIVSIIIIRRNIKRQFDDIYLLKLQFLYL